MTYIKANNDYIMACVEVISWVYKKNYEFKKNIWMKYIIGILYYRCIAFISWAYNAYNEGI